MIFTASRRPPMHVIDRTKDRRRITAADVALLAFCAGMATGYLCGWWVS